MLIALLLLAQGCTATGEVEGNGQNNLGGEDQGTSSGGQDMNSVPDSGTPAEVDMGSMTTPPTAMDMGSDVDLGGEEDMGVVPVEDMAPEVDMTPETWPEHSGTACDVDGAGGVCLPTSRCPWCN